MPGTGRTGGDWSSLSAELIQEVTQHVSSKDRAVLRQASQHWMSAISAGVSCAKLDLSSSSGYWENVQQRLLLAYPQATELVLHGGTQAKDASTKLSQLRRWAAFLHSLTITGGTPLDVWCVPRCWQTLLQLQRLPGSAAAPVPALCQFTGLRRLSLDCCLGFPAPHALSGLSSLKELSHLELHSSSEPAVTWCALVGGACYAALADPHLAVLSSSCPGLVSLRLTHLTDASPQGLGLLVGRCRALTQLELGGPWRAGLCLQQAAQGLTTQLQQQLPQQQQRLPQDRRLAVQDQQLVLISAVAGPGLHAAATSAAAAACTQRPSMSHQPDRRGSIDSCSSMYSAGPGSRRSSIESSCSRPRMGEGPSRSSLDAIIGGLTALGARNSMDSSSGRLAAAAGGGGVGGACGGVGRCSVEGGGILAEQLPGRLGARGSMESSSSQLASAAAAARAAAVATRPSMDSSVAGGSVSLSRLGGRGSMESSGGLKPPPRADVAGGIAGVPGVASGAVVPCSGGVPWVGQGGVPSSSACPGGSSYDLATRSSFYGHHVVAQGCVPPPAAVVGGDGRSTGAGPAAGAAAVPAPGDGNDVNPATDSCHVTGRY